MQTSRRLFWAAIFVGVILEVIDLIPEAFHYEFGAGYLTFHFLAELFTVLVALLAGYYSLRYFRATSEERYLVLGLVLWASGAADVVHLLVFGGMPTTVLMPSANAAIYFWLGARIIMALGILVSAFADSRSSKTGRSLFCGSVLAVIVFAALYGYAALRGPELETFISITGLAPTKIILEYAIIGVFLLSAFLYWKRMRDWKFLYFLLSFLVLSVLSEFSFTLYQGAYYSENFLGHVLKILAYAVLLAALPKLRRDLRSALR